MQEHLVLGAEVVLHLRSGRTAGGGIVLTPDSVRLMREEGRLRPTGTGTGYGLGWRVGGLDAPLDDAIWHTGATPGYSAMLFLLPERNIAIVLQQNLHGILHDAAVMEVGFGAARLLAGGGPPVGGASASGYHVTVWSVTALAMALILAAGRSALLLRRPAVPASLPRRVTVTAAWTLAGSLPWIALARLVGRMGTHRLATWVPDTFIAMCVAATAGAAVVALRLTIALRTTRSRRRSE
ncbi:hypothetical protein GCM10009780_61370 [Actinomadura alba]